MHHRFELSNTGELDHGRKKPLYEVSYTPCSSVPMFVLSVCKQTSEMNFMQPKRQRDVGWRLTPRNALPESLITSSGPTVGRI